MDQRPSAPSPAPAPAPCGQPLQLSLFDAPPAVQPSSGSTPGLRLRDEARPGPTTLDPAASPPKARPGPREPATDLRRGPPWQHPQAERSLTLEGQPISYALRRARRRSIGFSVGPDGLAVAAPRWVGLADIESALTSKARWIVGKLHEQAERSRRLQASRIQWAEGATLPFLGQPVVLLLDPRVAGVMLDATGAAGQLVIQGVAHTCLRVGLPQTAEATQIRDAVQGWLQRQAHRIFTERIAHFVPILKVRVVALKLSSAQTRWGSASADGTIRLNWRLVHFALPTIDYVVAHELAHLRHMDHSPRFWDVVRSVVPHMEQARGSLREELLPPLD